MHRTAKRNARISVWLTLAVTALAMAAIGLCLSAVAQQDAARPAPVLKAHNCPAGDVETVAALLLAEYQNAADVLIVPNPRTQQLLVQAPPEVHSRIAQRLAALQRGMGQGASRAAQGAAGSSRVFDPHAPKSTTLALQHIATEQLEDALTSLFGPRLTPVQPSELGARSYQLSLPGNRSIRIELHPQTGRVALQGPAANVEACVRLVQAVDIPQPTGEESLRLIALRQAAPATARRIVEAIQASNGMQVVRGPMVASLFQQSGDGLQPPAAAQVTTRQPPREAATPPVRDVSTQVGADAPPPAAPAGEAAPPPAPGQAAAGQPARAGQEGAGMIGAVQVQLLEGLDVLVISGHQRDVKRVQEIIEQIERLAAETEPAIEVYQLRYVNSIAIADLIGPLYDEIFFARRGDVSITALVKPNALLLIGRRENVQLVIDLVRKLDKPVAPDTQFQVFRLKHAAAATVQATVQNFFVMQYGLGTRVWAVADYRSNSLFVQASPRDMVEVAALIQKIDTPTSEAVHELRVITLQNSLADEMANVLMSAITGQVRAVTAVPGAAAPAAPAAQAAAEKATMLRFVTIDAQGQRKLSSGILTDVRITPDTRANTLLVSAPAESMDLIEALVRQLDQPPSAVSQVKVFTIVNGDATALADMLATLFARPATQTALGLQLQTAAGEGESTLIPLRLAVDVRTNSIIASGSMGDLQVVEAILLRLDESDIRKRKTVVYRLKNAPATDVANTINQFLQSERQVQMLAPGLVSAFEQVEREVVVVAEPVSNSLIVSATERYFNEIKKIVEQLDERPPMVLIQVLIAEVSLNNTDEFGVELGLQDSILFDRSLLQNITTVTRTTYNEFGQPTSQGQEIVSATYVPGFAFNNQPLGQSTDPRRKNLIGTQGLSHFGVGRLNNELGFGGFVFSASSESVSVLIRALKECRRLEVLSRPQVMTLDNQPAFVQVGQRVPRITGTTVNQMGQVNSVTLENVGLILGVTPRISPDGLVVMAIDAEKSEVGPEAEGIPVSISATGQIVRSPRINTTMAQTTVSAASGQTIVLGGLIVKSKSEFHRKVPLLGDIPIVGHLFRYDGVADRRSELLIIMTPHIVRNQAEAEEVKRIESARMHWCLSDVLEVHGRGSQRQPSEEWSEVETEVIYPHMDPLGVYPRVPGAGNGPELVPAPPGEPAGGRVAPANGSQQPKAAPQLVEPPEQPQAPSDGSASDGQGASSHGQQLHFGPQLQLRQPVQTGRRPTADGTTRTVQPAIYQAGAVQPPGPGQSAQGVSDDLVSPAAYYYGPTHSTGQAAMHHQHGGQTHQLPQGKQDSQQQPLQHPWQQPSQQPAQQLSQHPSQQPLQHLSQHSSQQPLQRPVHQPSPQALHQPWPQPQQHTPAAQPTYHNGQQFWQPQSYQAGVPQQPLSQRQAVGQAQMQDSQQPLRPETSPAQVAAPAASTMGGGNYQPPAGSGQWSWPPQR